MLDRVERRAAIRAPPARANAPHATADARSCATAAEPAPVKAAPASRPAPAPTPVVVAVAVAPPVAAPVLSTRRHGAAALQRPLERPFDAAVGRSVLAAPPVENPVVTASIPPFVATPEAIETPRAPVEAPKPRRHSGRGAEAGGCPGREAGRAGPGRQARNDRDAQGPGAGAGIGAGRCAHRRAADARGTVELPNVAAVPLPHPRPPLTPAQRLALQGQEYDKAEHCLAQAVYFEARNEPMRGQQAVAQVVLNRVFSPHYPKDVCSVVYQNAHRHLSCQFTFACDGKSEAIRERGAWARAHRIAKQTLEAKIWLPEVAKATHYHAAYVRPNWIRDMKVMVRHGLHTFYRPRNWGDGSQRAAAGAARRIGEAAPPS